jgi:hypothetical protein
MRITTFARDAFEGQFALRLRSCCRVFGLDLDLYTASAEERLLPFVRLLSLVRSLRASRGEDVLYVDPDAQLLRRPAVVLDERDYDVGLYCDSRTFETSGPIFLKNSPRLNPLLREWDAANRAHPDRPELENFSRALAGPGHSLTVRRFPVTYSWVESLHRRTHPTAQPVIVHFRMVAPLSGPRR